MAAANHEDPHSTAASDVLTSLVPFARMPAQLDAIAEQIDRNATGSEAQQRNLEDIRTSIAAIRESHATLTGAIREIWTRNQLRLEEIYEQRILDPHVNWLLLMIDLIDRVLAEAAEPGDSPAHARALKALRNYMLEHLKEWGIEVLESRPGAPIDLRVMAPTQQWPTDDHSLDGKVARSLRAGIRRGSKLFRPEDVVAYQLKS